MPRSGRKKQPQPRPTATPPTAISSANQPGILKVGDVIEVECGPLLAGDRDPAGPAIEMLRKRGFGKWPSSSFGLVRPEVLEQLKRAHQILDGRGFVIVDDPMNPLGDGKNWDLKCKPPIDVESNSDAARLAYRCLIAEGIRLWARPMPDGDDLVIPVSCGDSVVLHSSAQTSKTQIDGDAPALAAERKRQIGNRRVSGKSKSQRCANDVAKILKELYMLSQSIDAGQEDYERLRRENPGFLTFKAVQHSPQLRDQILSLASRRGRLVGLAQKLAGVLHGRKPETVKKDWKDFKPAEHRQHRAAS